MSTLVKTDVSEYTNIIAKSFLQSGNDLKLNDDFVFKHPTVNEIFALDKEHNGLFAENVYNQIVSVFLTDPYANMVYLDDKGIDYEFASPFDVFILKYNDRMLLYKMFLHENSESDISKGIMDDIYFKAFEFFIGVKNFVIVDANDDKLVCTTDGKVIFDRNTYNYIYCFLKGINGFQETERINPDTKFAKKMLIDDERERLKREQRKKQSSDEEEQQNRLGNMLSSITWGCGNAITPFNRGDLHIYDLFDGINRSEKRLSYQLIMQGIYGGTIDRKKIDVQKIHWSTD